MFIKPNQVTYKFFFLWAILLSITVSTLCHAKERIVKIGVYENPPIVFADKNGGYSGFAVETLEYIAVEESWEIEYVFGNLAECLERLEQGAIDVQVYIAYSKERALKYDFNQETLLDNWGVVYVRPDSGIETILELDKKRVALLMEAIHPPAFLNLIQSFNIEVEIIPINDHDAGFALVSEHKADAVVANRVFGLANAKKYHIEATNIIFNPIDIRYAVPKGENADILTAIDKHLKVLKADKRSVFYTSFNKAFDLNEPGTLFPQWIYWSGLLALFLFVLLILFTRILNHKIHIRTTELQHEVAERERTVILLKESESRLGMLINTIPELVWLKDIRGTYLLCNTRFEQYFGHPEKDIVGKSDYEFVDKELADSFQISDKVAIDTGKPRVNEEELVFADGHKEIAETIKTPMYDSDGKILGVLGITRDITERKRSDNEKERLEKKLQQAQKMEAIGTLTGGIAHDFNNILAVIIGNVELAQGEATPGTMLQECLEQIEIAANRAADLVTQILAFSRQGRDDRIPLNIQPLIQEGLKMLRSSLPSTISITEDIDIKNGSILANPTQIQQILMNLCTNAYHAMEEAGGALSVILKTTSIGENEQEELLQVQPGEYIELTVSDTGCGIEPDIITMIFDPYFTTKGIGKGTGMGLSITHSIINDYGGAITVESQIGKGTAFHVYFPVIGKGTLSKIKESENIPRGKERILFIDDEEFLAKMSKIMLEMLGYYVTVRCSSLEALATFQDTPNEFDLVITDQTMPDMIGSDLARRMMQIRADIPIILCTGYSNLINEDSAKALGIKAFALKPLTKEVIAKLIRKVLK